MKKNINTKITFLKCPKGAFILQMKEKRGNLIKFQEKDPIFFYLAFLTINKRL